MDSTKNTSLKASPSIWSINGRMPRWDYFLIWAITSMIVMLSGFVSSIEPGGPVVAVFMVLPCIWVSLCAAGRRQHDLGRSAWWNLVFLIPIANLAMWLNLLFSQGQSKANIYGSSTSASADSVSDPVVPAAVTTSLQQSERQHEAHRASRSVVGAEESSTVSEEFLWALAMKEVEGPNRRTGLWAKVFSQSGGDENKAKAAYLAQRVAELQAEQVHVVGERKTHG